LWFSLSVGEALNEDQDHARAADLDRVVSDALWRLRTTEPDNATLWCELGRTMNHGGVFDLGFECIETAYRLAPGDPKILRSYGLALCRQGRMAEGLGVYDQGRWHLEDFEQRPFPYPSWSGESLSGKNILVWGEQGVGDQVMQARCLTELLESGAAVTLECDPRLISLFARSYRNLQCVPQLIDPSPALMDGKFDFQSSLLSAWRWTSPGHLSANPQQPYLTADEALTAQFRTVFRQRGWAINIGLSWRSAAKKIGHKKSIDPILFKPLMTDQRITYHCLQYDCGPEELGRLNTILELPMMLDSTGDARHNLDRLAAQIAALDLVISIDNTTVHLAGAVGTPCWVLLPVYSDWRWGVAGSETPLYADMRLYRQKHPDAWGDVLGQVALDLERRAEDDVAKGTSAAT